MYTKTEVVKLKENLRAIKQYCLSEICPAMVYDRDISVSFSACINGKEQKYTMMVGKDGSIGLLNGAMYLSFNEEYCGVAYMYSVYDNAEYAAPLILNWQEVKQRLHTQIHLYAEEHYKIMNFCV